PSAGARQGHRMTWRHVPDATRCAVGSGAVEAQGEAPAEAQGEAPAEAQGEAPAEAQGEAPAEAQGEAPAEAQGEPAAADAMPPWWTPWARLTRAGKLGRALAIGFFTWHVVAMMTMGAGPPVRRVASRVVGFYGDRMKMTN